MASKFSTSWTTPPVPNVDFHSFSQLTSTRSRYMPRMNGTEYAGVQSNHCAQPLGIMSVGRDGYKLIIIHICSYQVWYELWRKSACCAHTLVCRVGDPGCWRPGNARLQIACAGLHGNLDPKVIILFAMKLEKGKWRWTPFLKTCLDSKSFIRLRTIYFFFLSKTVGNSFPGSPCILVKLTCLWLQFYEVETFSNLGEKLTLQRPHRILDDNKPFPFS